jgi:hypothetical protein
MRDICILVDEKTETYYAISSGHAASKDGFANAAVRAFKSKDYGEMKIVFSGETLWLEQRNGTRERLSALNLNNLFAIEGNEFLRVRLNGKTLELIWWNDPNPRIFVKK